MEYEVELRVAFEWTCEECGRDNFVRPISVDPQSDEGEEWKSHFNVDSEDEAIFVWKPFDVTCPHCDSTYKVYHEDDD